MKDKLFGLLILFSLLGYYGISQTVSVTGKVSDSLNIPLSYANVIASPQTANSNLKFSITDDDGRYHLSLAKGTSYTISISYLGYYSTSFEFDGATDLSRDLVLKEKANRLEEVFIELPVTVKEDTIIYNTSKFITGDERKLKNVLKKLPGVKVSKDGSVSVQGKKVTKMLVEGKKFFNGGTKLAVENIPANAVDKVQVIKDYNEIAFLKGLTDTDELAMNIQLKEDKKRFVFGDLAAGKGNQDFYRAHSNLFYYSPETTLNFIGNLNNTGEKTLTFRDYMNFQGGISAMFTDGSSFFNTQASGLGQFLESRDVLKSSNRFAAANYRRTVSKGLDISGYAIFSDSGSSTLRDAENMYPYYTENTTTSSGAENLFVLGKITVEYAPSDKVKWYSKSLIKVSDNQKINNIAIQLVSLKKNIQSTSTGKPVHVEQVFEWHKKASKEHTFSMVANLSLSKNSPKNLWETNQPILLGLIPVIPTDIFQLQQLKTQDQLQLKTILKHFWVLNANNHLYTTVGNEFLNEQFSTTDSQLLEDGTENDFGASGFGNLIDYNLNDLYLGMHYKFRTGISTFKQGVFLHSYSWTIDQQSKKQHNKVLLLPDFLAEFKFNKSKKLRLTYKLKTAFSGAASLANRYYLSSYKSVFQGNENLENERYHSASAFFSRYSMYRGIRLSAGLNYLKKVRGKVNTVQFSDTDHYVKPELFANSNERMGLHFTLDKKIKQIKYYLSSDLSASNGFQPSNNQVLKNKNKKISYKVSAKTLFDKFPIVELGFSRDYGYYKTGANSSKYVVNEPFLNIDYDFLKGFILTIDYSKYSYTNQSTKSTNKYEIANAILTYHKEDSPWSFRLDMQNIFDVKFKRNHSFSAYVISDSRTYILPRMILFSLEYHL